MELLQSAFPRLPPVASAADHFRAQFHPLAVTRSAESRSRCRRLRTVSHAAIGAGFVYTVQSRNGSSLVCEFQPLAVTKSAESRRRRLRTVAHAAIGAGFVYTVRSRNGSSLVSEFMTKKEDLHVLKPSTPVAEALRALVECEISSFPVIDEEWNLVGIVSDYDLLALASLPGGDADTDLFPEAHSSWKAFLEIQKLLCKTNGRVVSDVMTSTPLTVYETTSLEDATRLMLETKYARVPVVDGNGLLVGIITREDVVRAARQIK